MLSTIGDFCSDLLSRASGYSKMLFSYIGTTYYLASDSKYPEHSSRLYIAHLRLPALKYSWTPPAGSSERSTTVMVRVEGRSTACITCLTRKKGVCVRCQLQHFSAVKYSCFSRDRTNYSNLVRSAEAFLWTMPQSMHPL